MKALKFRISSPEQSERLQKVLFKLGYGWCGDSKEVCNTDRQEIYTRVEGSLTWTDDSLYFEQHNNKEKDTEKFIAKHSGEKKPKKSKWQSVEEGLPESDKHVLVYCEEGNYHVAFHGDYGKWLTITDDHYLSGVTFWRELPKGPKA